MVKGKRPFLSLLSSGRWGRHIRVVHRGRTQIIQASPDPPDVKSLAQLSWRHMYQKAVALWHALSAAEKVSWEGAGTSRHMTGFAWFMSQCLKPNPGLYLPLQGGNMTGDIDMDGNAIEDLPDPGAPQDAGTQAARDAAIAAALADCIDNHIHGWDGADWQKLLTESNTLHNLRVRLYAGGTSIAGSSMNATVDTTKLGLDTNAIICGRSGNSAYSIAQGRANSDAMNVNDRALKILSQLCGFNGASWERLRTYPTGILKVGRAEIGLSTPRKVAPGQVKASAGNLYWMLLNPSAGNSLFELTDDLDGLGAVVCDHFDTSREGHMLTFDPPMQFTSGIYLKTLTNITSIIFGFK